MKKLIIVIFFILFPSMVTLYCCSVFSFSAGGNYYAGKNLDWPVGDGILIVNPRGIERSGKIVGSGDTAGWTSSYGSVTFNQFGNGHPLGGMNEKGLVIEELSYSPSRFPDHKSVPVLNEFQWIQYHLDNSDSLQNVLRNLHRVTIRKVLTGLHYFLCDKSGACAVVEFIDKKTVIYTDDNLPVCALTNNRYDRMLNYLSFYSGFGGEKAIPESTDSPSRFVRLASSMKKQKYNMLVQPVDSAFRLLKLVRQNDTRWRIVYDMTNLRISFKTDKNHMVTLVDLRDLNFEIANPLYKGIYDTRLEKISKGDFLVYSNSAGSCFVLNVLHKLIDAGELKMDQFQLLRKTFIPSR